MVLSEYQSLTVAVGVFIGLLWSRRTGWSCGGIITPALLALHSDAFACLFSLAVGTCLTLPLRIIKNALELYGRERIGAAMLLAIAVKITASYFFPEYGFINDAWIGWVIPGLIAADCERQGVLMTLCGAVSCGIAAKFVMFFASAGA